MIPVEISPQVKLRLRGWGTCLNLCAAPAIRSTLCAAKQLDEERPPTDIPLTLLSEATGRN